jgi:S-adenosylmethionine:tRNA ribosyltransferase-isomerase
VRALEDSARRWGRVVAGTHTADLVLDAESAPRVVTGLLTGIHMPGESHYRLLSAFCAPDTLRRAADIARSEGYRMHEFGDAALLLPDIVARRRRAA